MKGFAVRILIIGSRGYLGSALNLFLLSDGYDVTSWDLIEGKDYAGEDVSGYDVIVLLAGHSSVLSCRNNLRSAWRNNVDNFVGLLARISPVQKLIYASSGSVYGMVGRDCLESDSLFSPVDVYDLTKQTIDNVSSIHIDAGYQIAGLRLGTVNGPSLNLRVDLMLNKMVASSLDENVVRVTNQNAWRSVLSISDFCRAIRKIIDGFVPGIFNLSSFDGRVIDFACVVSNIVGSNIKIMDDVPNVYDFTLNTDKFCDAYDFEFESTVEDVVKNLKESFFGCNVSNRNDAWKY